MPKVRSLKAFRASGCAWLLQQSTRLETHRAATPTPSKDEQVDEGDAPEALRRALLGLYLSGNIPASMLVRLAYLITKAGGRGVGNLGRDLKHNKNAARLVTKCLGTDVLKQECLQFFDIPQSQGKGKAAQRRPLALI